MEKQLAKIKQQVKDALALEEGNTTQGKLKAEIQKLDEDVSLHNAC